MTMTETLNQPISGWTAWCLSQRGIPRESRAPIVRQPSPEKTSTQENRHAG